MKTTTANPVRVTTSTRMPPWFGYVSPTVSTMKVGGVFVTVEVAK